MMGETKKYSTFIRTVSGVLGILGFASMVLNGLGVEAYEFGLIDLSAIFASCIFLFVAATGRNPLARANRKDDVEQ